MRRRTLLSMIMAPLVSLKIVSWVGQSNVPVPFIVGTPDRITIETMGLVDVKCGIVSVWTHDGVNRVMKKEW